MPTHILAILSLLLATTIWGTVFVVTKSALAEVPPLLFALMRNGIAALLLLPLARGARGEAGERPRWQWGILVLMGLTGVTLHFAGQTLSLQYTSASEGALIQGTIPALTALLGVAFLGERLSRARGFGIFASMLGVALIVLAAGESGGGSNPLLGNLLMLGACLCWAVYTILAKRMAGTPQMALTAYVTALGAAMLVPMVAYELFRSPPVIITPGTWLAALYLGAFASGLNLLLWNRALQALDASVAGNFINLVPVIGVATAALFLGEWPAPVQLVGGLLVLLGVWISSRSPSRVAAPPA